MLPNMIELTSDQAQAVEASETPIRARDSRNREYVIVRSDLFERMQRVMEVEELDRTFYECEDETASQ